MKEIGPRRRTVLAAAGALLVAPSFVRSAAALSAPTAAPILTVTGMIAVRNGDAGAAFDRAMLDALPQDRFATTNDWEPALRTYEGPTVRGVLAAVGANGRTLKITALNDYSVTMPTAEDQPQPMILAVRVDGQPLSVRTKGPLWVMYNFDADPAVRTEAFKARAIWGVKSIEVMP